MKQCGIWRSWLLAIFWGLVSSYARITTKLDALDGSYPPNEPQIPEITGPFTVKIVVRFDDIAGGSAQRMFDFGDPISGGNIRLMQRDATTDILFEQTTGFLDTSQYVSIADALTQGTTDTWEASIDATGRMSVAKNGIMLGFNDTGVVPVPGQVVGNYKIGQPNGPSIAGNQLTGAVLGLQVTNHNDTASQGFRSLNLWNIPAQVFGHDFVASFYLRMDNLDPSRYFQRIFDFGNGQENAVLAFSQYQNTQDVYLEMWQGTTDIFQCRTTTSTIVEGEMALWRVEMTAGDSYIIEKNGDMLAQCNVTAAPSPEAVFRQNLYIGQSNWAGDPLLQGVILGLRVDLKHNS